MGTVGKPWVTGTFGCVRSGGWQVHEGLDIRCLARDKKGEPIEPILATADGTVVYVSNRSALSNYGKYVVIRHQIEGLEIYSLYAHLREIRQDLKPGQLVKAGESIATMGRTANTREGISKDRAHLHFELNLLANERFASWYKSTHPGQRNDHGTWNGQNFLGIDPRMVLIQKREQGANFSLTKFLRSQTEMCRVMVRKSDFSWLRRFKALVRNNPTAEKEGVAGYEMVLNFNGVPFELIPRAASEIKTKSKFQLLSVNEAEYSKNPGRRIIAKKGSRFQLTQRGMNLLDLMTHH